jgi:regulator of protease activity HflC (stomatin/prohibitin superfamily)
MTPREFKRLRETAEKAGVLPPTAGELSWEQIVAAAEADSEDPDAVAEALTAKAEEDVKRYLEAFASMASLYGKSTPALISAVANKLPYQSRKNGVIMALYTQNPSLASQLGLTEGADTDE